MSRILDKLTSPVCIHGRLLTLPCNICEPDALAPGAGPAPRDPLLVARQRTHGDFRSNAEISQRIKKIFRDNTVTVSPGTSNVHLEALDIIALKLSRILSGQADYADHWRDVAGYAKLAEEACSPMRGLTDYVEPKK
jgi:hypothetical protein